MGKYGGNNMDALEAIVSGAPAFAVVSPLRQEEEEWFDSNNFEVGDPSSLGPGHHAAAGARDRPALGAANQSAPPAGAAAAQAQAAVGGSSVPSKRRRIVAVDDGGKSIANGDGLFSERRNKKRSFERARQTRPGRARLRTSSAGDECHSDLRTTPESRRRPQSRDDHADRRPQSRSSRDDAPVRKKRFRVQPYEKVYDMRGVQRARFFHNRKDAESTYLPPEDALFRISDGAPRDGRLDLCGWGVRDDDMSAVAAVVMSNVDARAGTGGVTSLSLDKCWRLTDEGMKALALPFLDHTSPSRLESVSVAGCSLLTNQAAFCLYRAFSGLSSIDVSGTAITDDGLQLILGAGKELCSLGLRDLPGLTDRGLAAVLQCIKKRRRLQELKLCRSLRFSDDGLLALLSAGGLLRELDLHGCSQLSELCLMGLERAAFTSTRLKILDLRGMAIADIGLAWVAQGCKVLENLNISRCNLLTDLALEYLAKVSGGEKPLPLKVLNISGVGGFTDEGMAVLMPRSGSTLEDITLDGATSLGDGAVRAIARHCPSLTSLSMVELTRTLDRSLKELGRRCPLLRVLDSSSDINVLETSHRTRVPKLGADGIREMCVGTPLLTVLRLNGACKLTDEALVEVGAHCPLLEELCIRSCIMVTDVGLAALIRGCPKLRHVSAGGCIRLSDDSVKVLAHCAGGRLRALDVTGCRGVTDASLEAIGKSCRGLESLALQGCDMVTDEGFTALLRGCPNITTLNLRGVPDLTEAAVAAVETRCRRLRRLNMEGIPQVSGSRVQLAGERLPLVKRVPGTRILTPCALPCRVFNAHVQERVEWTAAAIAVQRVTRGKLHRLSWSRGEQKKALAAMTLKIKLGAVVSKRMFRKRLMQRRAEHAAARTIQEGVRGLFRRRDARNELNRRRNQRDGAISFQRVVRGRLGRRAAKDMRWKRQKARENWGWVVKRMGKQLQALGSWRTALSMVFCYLKLWHITRRHRQNHACRKIQRAWKRLLRRRMMRAASKVELKRRMAAAVVVQRAWRSCYRLKWFMRDIRLREQEFKRQAFKRECAQMELARWWRRVRRKNLKRTVLRQLAVTTKAVNVVKRAYRSYAARTLSVRMKKKAIAVRCRWRRVYLGLKRLPRPEDAIKIQRILRRFLRSRKRNRAATDIQRVYKGVLARRIFVVKLARMYTLNAITIQRVGRGHIARRGEVREILEANDSARILTRALRTYIRNKGFQRMVREARAKKARFDRAQRQRLVQQRAEATIRQALFMKEQKAAKAIQARWRQRLAKRKREEMRLLQIEMDKRMAIDKKLRQAAIDKRKKEQRGGVARKVGGALSALGRKFNKLTAQLDPELAAEGRITVEAKGEEEEEEEERPKSPAESLLKKMGGMDEEERAELKRQDADMLANSILNHQANSITQVGVCDIHITVGRKEQKAFAEAQDYLKSTKQVFMRCVEGDLSGKKQLQVRLWLKMGQGDGVVTDVRIQKAPPNHTNPAVAKARKTAAQETFHLLVTHNRCDLELVCRVLSRTEGTSAAVDDIVMCARKADEGVLIDRGYEKLQPQLKAVGLGKGFLFIHRKTFKETPKLLDVAKYRLRKIDWFTARTAVLLEKYVLTEENVVALHDIFNQTDYKGDGTMDIYSFFSEMGEVETRYGHWVLEAVGAGGESTDVTWDQYLEAVCFYSMFSRREVLRFVFGALDPSMRGYLEARDFQKFVSAVTQHESGIPGNYPGKAKRGFTRLARNGTQLEFPQFEQLCSQFPRLPHPVYRLQTAVQKHNLGEAFWDTKKETFTDARRAVGVEKTNS